MTREAMLQSIEMLAVCFRSHSGSPIDHEVRDKKANEVAAARADIEALFAERDVLREKLALHERRQVIFEESDRDLRAAVLAIAEDIARPPRGWLAATQAREWAAELRKACEVGT